MYASPKTTRWPAAAALVGFAAASTLGCASAPAGLRPTPLDPTPEELAALELPASERPPLPPVARLELVRQLELIDAFVPDERREDLRLTEPDVEYLGVATSRAAERLARVVRERTPALQSCLDSVSPSPGIGWVSLVVGGEGIPEDVRVGVAGGGAAPTACLLERVEAWRLPRQPYSSGGLVWFQVVGAAPPRNGDGPTRPRGAIVRPPRTWRPECLEERLPVALRLAGAGPPAETFHVRFLVEADGTVSDIHFLEAVPARVARATRFAVAGCGWAPADDAAGRGVAAWAVVGVGRGRAR